MKRRWRMLLIIALVAAAAVGAYWWLLPKGTDEQQVQDVIVKLGQGIEEENVGRCMSLVSKDYHDSLGNTRLSLRRLALDAFRTADAISVASYNPQVDVTGNEATVTVDTRIEAVTSGKREKVEPTVTLRMRREGWLRKWRIVNAEGWQAEAGADLSDYL